MSKELIEKLITMGGTLFSVIIGSLITLITALIIERKRYRYKRQEKLAVLRQDALSVAFDWIDSMRNALIRASSLLMAVIKQQIDIKQFRKNFPNLLCEVSKKDLPSNKHLMLPEDIYSCGLWIVSNIEQLKDLGIKYGQEALSMNKPMAGFQEISDKLEVINKKILKLETNIREEYHRTLE